MFLKGTSTSKSWVHASKDIYFNPVHWEEENWLIIKYRCVVNHGSWVFLFSFPNATQYFYLFCFWYFYIQVLHSLPYHESFLNQQVAGNWNEYCKITIIMYIAIYSANTVSLKEEEKIAYTHKIGLFYIMLCIEKS